MTAVWQCRRWRLGILAAALCFFLPFAAGMWADTLTPVSENRIRWVDFDIPYEALDYALELDIRSHTEEEVPLCWTELLAVVAARQGGFSGYRREQLTAVAKKLQSGVPIETLTEKLPSYPYYREAYGAVLDGLVGVYEQEKPDAGGNGTVWELCYGLKGFSPIAQGYWYQDYDDFGASRSYGFARRHLGHDLMGTVGTPIIAVESGTVEAIGWNRYGGWRIGIRSHDRRRYYYYAHLRKDHPFAEGLTEGSEVTAGDVIGYLGRTGYSEKENVNNIDTYHLHFGLQLVFDESQKECDSEIWIDVYALTRLLYRRRSAVVRPEGSRDYVRRYGMRENRETADYIKILADIPAKKVLTRDEKCRIVSLCERKYHSLAGACYEDLRNIADRLRPYRHGAFKRYLLQGRRAHGSGGG